MCTTNEQPEEASSFGGESSTGSAAAALAPTKQRTRNLLTVNHQSFNRHLSTCNLQSFNRHTLEIPTTPQLPRFATGSTVVLIMSSLLWLRNH
jgi:hypothetical protein